MGSKPTSSTNTTQTSAPPSWVTSAYQSTIGQAQNQAATPYTPYTGQLVAPVNSQQSSGIGNINSAYGLQNPYNATAGTTLGSIAGGSINPGSINASTIAQYESPYQSQVVNSTEAEIQNANAQQAAALQGSTVASGAMGGDRAGVAQAALAGQQAIANNATLASLNNQNYEQALGQATTEQQLGMTAQEQTAQNQLAAASGLGSLGNTAQTEALNEANAQVNAGTLQQQTSQASDTANYNQYLQQLAYPYQNLSWLSSIEGGLGSLAGGTTTGSSETYSSSPLSTILGGVLGLGSLLIPGQQSARGGRVPKRASGGSLTLGSLGGAVDSSPAMPYSTSGEVAPGAGSWVPGSVQISAGHTLPSGSTGTGAGAQSQTNPITSGLQTAQQINQLGQGLGSLGTSLNTLGFAANPLGDLGGGDDVSGLLDTFMLPVARGGRANYDSGGEVSSEGPVDPEDLVDQTLIADTNSGFAKGGGLNLGMVARGHFDDGGYVSPDDLLFDPNAISGMYGATPPQAPSTAPAPAPIPTWNQNDPKLTPISLGNLSQQPSTFDRIVNQESGGRQFDSSGAPLIGSSGEIGISQIEPGTAREMAASIGIPFDESRLATDPQYNYALGKAYYQKQLSDFGSPDRAAAAYNAGPGSVSSALAKADRNGGSYLDYLPASTRRYVANVTGMGRAPLSLASVATPSDALGYDDNGNFASLGLGAIANATRAAPQQPASSTNDNPIAAGLGAIGNIVSGGLGSIGRAVSGQNASPSGSGFGISDNMRLGLLSAGLGMMGGNSKNPWQNIGQGGLEGIQAMQSGAKNAAEIGLQRAQTQGVLTDNQIKQLQVKMMFDGLNQMQNLNKQYEARVAQQPPVGNNVTAPTVTNPTIAGKATGASPSGATAVPQQAPVDPNTGKQIDREWDPAYLAAAADAYSRMGPQWAQVANTYRQRLTQIGQTGRVMFADGTWGNVPGFVGAEAQKAAATAAASAPSVSPGGYSYFGGNSAGQTQQPSNPVASSLAGTPSTLQIDPKTANIRTSIPAPPPGGGYPTPDVPQGAKVTGLGEGAKEIQKADAAFENSAGQLPAVQQNIQRYQSMAQAFKLFQSGSVTDRLAAGAALAQSFGYPEMAQRILGGDPAAVQWIGKEAPNLVLQTLRAATPRFAQTEFNTLTARGTPNPDLLPQTNHEFIAEGLGFEERTKAFIQDWQKAQTMGWESPSAFYAVWSERNPLNGFIQSAERQIGNFKGMALPPSTEWTPGTIYVAPTDLSPAYAAALAKRGVQPGQLFRFAGRDSTQPIQPIQPTQNFTSFLGQPQQP